jgi:hypothetical protein
MEEEEEEFFSSFFLSFFFFHLLLVGRAVGGVSLFSFSCARHFWDRAQQHGGLISLRRRARRWEGRGGGWRRRGVL